MLGLAREDGAEAVLLRHLLASCEPGSVIGDEVPPGLLLRPPPATVFAEVLEEDVRLERAARSCWRR